MQKLTLTAAFATYGATLKNTRWAFSAIARDGSLVLSCWKHFLKSFVDGHKHYEDHLSRWATDTPGKKLLTEHLKLAVARDLPVRLVVATVDEPAKDLEREAGTRQKTFSVHVDMVGKVVEFDGNRFAIDFHPR